MVGPNWEKASPEENVGPPTHLFKIVIIGDENCGKTSFVRRFTSDAFQESYTPTIGIDFAVKTLVTPDKSVIKLQVWDTAGQERFRSITSSYFRGAHGILLMYDITDRTTFQHLSPWLENIRGSTADDVVIILVGNKVDDEDNRQVTTEEALKFAHENDLKVLFETSVKNDVNIVNAMEALSTEMMAVHAKRRGAKPTNITQKATASLPVTVTKPSTDTSNDKQTAASDKISPTGEENAEVKGEGLDDTRYRVKLQTKDVIILKNENSRCGKSKCC